MNNISGNIKKLRSELNEGVTLVCVSKTKPCEEIQQAYECGERIFGENKAQELRDKYDKLPKDIKWHFIGHLQRNKVKYIAGKVDLLHSLDGVKLLHELEKKYSMQDEKLNALIQINIGKEENKTGILLEELEGFIMEIEKCENIRIRGLMAIIPKGTEEECRGYFKSMKEVFERLSEFTYKNISMEILSMGMSGDYGVAVEEGSNMIRVGTGIFGSRNR